MMTLAPTVLRVKGSARPIGPKKLSRTAKRPKSYAERERLRTELVDEPTAARCYRLGGELLIVRVKHPGTHPGDQAIRKAKIG